MRAMEFSPGAASADADVRGVAAQPSDAQLFALVRAKGGRAAARQIYRRFSDQVNGIVWRLLGPDAEHDDQVNEIFLRVIDGIESVREAERLSGWVMTVTVNVVRDDLRKRSRWRRLFRHFEPQELDDRPAPVPDHEGRRLVQRAFALMSRLPVEERLSFSLRYVEQRSLPETAELCGCSLATAKRRIARAQRRFRRLAADEPELSEWLGAGATKREAP